MALAILLDERENSEVRLERIREAALKPELYNKLWSGSKHGIQSDENLKFQLSHEMNFNPNSVKMAMEKYKATMEFAAMKDVTNLSDKETDKGHPEREQDAGSGAPPTPKGSNKGTTAMANTTVIGRTDTDLPILLGDGGTAILRIPTPISPSDYDLLASICYSWSSPIMNSDRRKMFAVLHVPPVVSAYDAVRASIIAGFRELQKPDSPSPNDKDNEMRIQNPFG